MSYGVGHRQGLDLELLCLWLWLAAVALIRPLAWEPPYAALKKQTKKKKQRKSLNINAHCAVFSQDKQINNLAYIRFI